VRLLSFDTGAENLGWSVLRRDAGLELNLYDNPYINAGVLKWPRQGRPQQEYRMEMTASCRTRIIDLIEHFEPDKIVTEIVPSQGSEGFLKSGQSYMANVVATVIHCAALELGVSAHQVSARTWASKIALRKTKSAKITKVQHRNGVLYHLPFLKQELGPGAFKLWDLWDAIGIGLFELGYRTPQP
jgi:hypothetical protein